MRTLVIGLSIALFTFAALVMANPRPVHAAGVGGGGGYSPGPANYLVFRCYWAPGQHPLQVWVEGYNQNANLVSHTFPAYYTYDNGYWWWLQGSYVWYQDIVPGKGWGPVNVAYVQYFGSSWQVQLVMTPDC
jgi:hypothetical protein